MKSYYSVFAALILLFTTGCFSPVSLQQREANSPPPKFATPKDILEHRPSFVYLKKLSDNKDVAAQMTLTNESHSHQTILLPALSKVSGYAGLGASFVGGFLADLGNWSSEKNVKARIQSDNINRAFYRPNVTGYQHVDEPYLHAFNNVVEQLKRFGVSQNTKCEIYPYNDTTLFANAHAYRVEGSFAYRDYRCFNDERQIWFSIFSQAMPEGSSLWLSISRNYKIDPDTDWKYGNTHFWPETQFELITEIGPLLKGWNLMYGGHDKNNGYKWRVIFENDKGKIDVPLLPFATQEQTDSALANIKSRMLYLQEHNGEYPDMSKN